MVEQLKNFIASEKLFTADDKILLTVSGGVDSVVMAELFHKAELKFAIAHCNFMLRGKEADDDEKFVEQLAKKYKVLFACEHFDTGKYAAENKLSIQTAARKLRYNWFNDILKKQKLNYIATAHHKNDVLETMLINFTRGTGIAGLHGILPKQGNIIRPLLFATKDNIERFAKENNLPFRYDSSNSSEKYVRNKIRMRIIPLLQEINPSIEYTAIQTSKNLYASELILKNHLQAERQRCIETRGKKININIKKLKQLNPLSTYLFEFLREYGFNYKLTEQICESINETPGKKFYSESHKLIKDREYLILSEIKGDDETEDVFVKKTEKKINSPLKLVIEKQAINKKFTIPSANNIACLDYDKLKFPLKLRRWLFGDRFVPLGMTGKKKVSDFLIDNKINVDDKEGVWLLQSGHEICWVIGHRIDDRYKITPETKKAFVIELK
jgi:tRNA(Ile)-lysidine synthase